MLENYGSQSLDKNELFVQFKENEGSEYVEAIRKHIVGQPNPARPEDQQNRLQELPA